MIDGRSRPLYFPRLYTDEKLGDEEDRAQENVKLRNHDTVLQ